MTEVSQVAIRQLRTFEQKARSGLLETGEISRLVGEMITALLILLSEGRPPFPRSPKLSGARPSSVDLYTADETGNPVSWIMSIPVPAPWSNLIIIDRDFFVYSERSGSFVMARPNYPPILLPLKD